MQNVANLSACHPALSLLLLARSARGALSGRVLRPGRQRRPERPHRHEGVAADLKMAQRRHLVQRRRNDEKLYD